MPKKQEQQRVRSGGLRASSLVAGNRDVARVPALISTALARTVVSPALARLLTDREPGPAQCTSAVWLGRACGRTVKLAVAADDCRAVDTRAIVSPSLPRGVDLAIGWDVLEPTTIGIDFARHPARIMCRQNDKKKRKR